MILSAHQPAYIPWLGYFHKITLCDVFVYYEHVSYSKKDFTARNQIKTSQGPMWLSVPVQKGNSDKIADLKIDNGTPWARRHFKSILSCYGKAEYFSTYRGFFEDFYAREYENFSEMNFELTQVFLRVLGIEVELIRSPSLGIDRAKNEGIFQMLEATGAKKIVFGAHGRDYVNVQEYEERGFQCYFQNYQHPTYPQLYGDFLPYMSTLDLIFNCGPRALTILKSDNILKAELFK